MALVHLSLRIFPGGIWTEYGRRLLGIQVPRRAAARTADCSNPTGWRLLCVVPICWFCGRRARAWLISVGLKGIASALGLPTG